MRLFGLVPTRTRISFGGFEEPGANFGVVTSFEFRLHPVAEVFAGGVVYPAERTDDALLFFDEFAECCPDELSMLGALWKDEDGEVRMSVGACFVGSPKDADDVLAPLRQFCPPDHDMFAVMPYPTFQSAKDANWPSGQQQYWKASSLSRSSRKQQKWSSTM